MESKDLIKAGRLSDARDQLVEEVKSSPADVGKRTLFFQVLALCGEWDKAERHLDVIASQDSAMGPGIQVYKDLIRGERERIDVQGLDKHPSFLPEAPGYMETYYAALEKLIDKDIEQAKTLFGQVDEGRPVISGTVNGKDFIGIKDSDTFLSCFIEAIVHERYVWIPIESIRELIISPPKTLFDLLWIEASITTWEGLSMNCFLPVLYPESFLHEDDRIRLGRMTCWDSLGGPFLRGIGQHVFDVGEAEIPLPEMHEVLFKLS